MNAAKQQVKDERKDVCVSCGKTTDVDSSARVEMRPHYVEGAGQLCPECWRRVYG
jgi:fatty acid/phospholipid biosynthesis enzyme